VVNKIHMQHTQFAFLIYRSICKRLFHDIKGALFRIRGGGERGSLLRRLKIIISHGLSHDLSHDI